MPQMAPMDWLFMYMYFSLIYYMSLILIYFLLNLYDKNFVNEFVLEKNVDFENFW